MSNNEQQPTLADLLGTDDAAQQALEVQRLQRLANAGMCAVTVLWDAATLQALGVSSTVNAPPEHIIQMLMDGQKWVMKQMRPPPPTQEIPNEVDVIDTASL